MTERRPARCSVFMSLGPTVEVRIDMMSGFVSVSSVGHHVTCTSPHSQDCYGRLRHEPQIHGQGPTSGAHVPRHQGVVRWCADRQRPQVTKEPADAHIWIICNCGIDPEWVQAHNSVLDNNRLLTMPNGQHIQFGTNVNFIFETSHLRFASPATINRWSVIFLSEENADIQPMIASWISLLSVRAPWRRSTCHGNHNSWHVRKSWDTWCLGRRRALEKTRSSFFQRLISFLLCAEALLAISRLTRGTLLFVRCAKGLASPSQRIKALFLRSRQLLSMQQHYELGLRLRHGSLATCTSGRIYRSKEGQRLVFYMKDINLPSPDKYDISEIVMFLSQVVMHNGFYDGDLEFVQVEHIQIEPSIAPASTLCRLPLAARLTANLRVCAISYPSMEELIEVYSQIVVAHSQTRSIKIWLKKLSLSCKVAEAIVVVYTNTRSKFTGNDHDHFQFNPRDLTLWVLQLLRYDIVSVDTLLAAWAYEANRISRNRLMEDHVDSMLRTQQFHSSMPMWKCFTTMVTFDDGGVPSKDLRRISLADYKKIVEEGLKSNDREVKDMPIDFFQGLWIILRAPTAPCLHRTTLTSCSWAALA